MTLLYGGNRRGGIMSYHVYLGNSYAASCYKNDTNVILRAIGPKDLKLIAKQMRILPHEFAHFRSDHDLAVTGVFIVFVIILMVIFGDVVVDQW